MPLSGKPWADGPFKLISTPEFLQNSNEPVDQYVKTASIMALSHNSILRALNSIYLQAPHVKAEDSKDFVGYCLCWHQVIENHHQGEEELLFPQIEALAGESGIMDLNNAQHHAFEEGLVAYATYLRSLIGHESDFSSTRLIAIIDSFSATLHEHLADEITSLLDLRKYDGEDQGQSKKKFPLLELTETTFHKYGMSMNKTEGSMMFWLNLDVTFEDNRWMNWPPIPWLVRFILTRMFTLWNSGWWKFASCDLDGKPKELYAVE